MPKERPTCDPASNDHHLSGGRDGITKKDIAAYHGMLVADQNSKLVAFATRPAVLNYATNTVSYGPTATPIKVPISLSCSMLLSARHTY